MTWRERPPEFDERRLVDPRPVGEGLDTMARRLGAPAASSLGAVFNEWEHAVGELVAAHARPVSLAGGVLTVAVDDPAWATQLRFLSSDLLARIAAVAGPRVVTSVEVKVAPQRA